MEYRYHLTERSAVPSILPSGGLVRANLCFDKPCGDTGWGVAVYDRPLTEEEIVEYHLTQDAPPFPEEKEAKRIKPLILHNRAKCLACGDVIESTYTHEFVICSCGNLSVDGGHDYLKRSVKDDSKYEELSVTIYPQFQEQES